MLTCSSLTNNPKFQDLLAYVTCIITKSVIPLIFALAVVLFVWGVVQFVINSDEEAKKEKGKQFMIWGIIALTVMVSVWGLVGILANTFDINTGFIPQVKTSTTSSSSSYDSSTYDPNDPCYGSPDPNCEEQ